MREKYTSACNNTEETHRLVQKWRMNQWSPKLQIELLDACAENRFRGSLTCGCAAIIIVLCVCVCVCVCCAQDVQTHCTTYTHASGCVNQHEGMFMYSV